MLVDVGALGYYHSGLVLGRQELPQLHLYHQPNHLGHRTVRNGRGEVDLHLIVVPHVTPLEVDHIELFQSQRVLGVIKVPDEFEQLELIDGVLNIGVELVEVAGVLVICR